MEPVTPSDPAAELARLRRQQRFWMWFTAIALAVTVFGYLCSRNDPAWHVASSSPPGTPYPSPQQPAGQYNLPPAATPPPADPDASSADAFTSFSLPLVRQRFASACPSAEVVPLPHPETTYSYLADRDCSGAFIVILYAPAPISRDLGVIAWGAMGPGASGEGTRLHLTWNCAIRVRPGSSDADTPLPFDVVRFGGANSGDKSVQYIPVLTAAQLSAELGP